MKKLLLSLLAAATFGGIASAQVDQTICYDRYASDNAALKKAPKAVFYGDSITDFWPGNAGDFFTRNNFVGRGCSGTVTSQMLARMRRDVIELHPKYFVLLAGINDIAQNQGEIKIEDTFRNIVSMIELARYNKITPIVCQLFPVLRIPWRPEVQNVSEKVEKFNTLLRNYCKENKIECVEYFADIDKSSGRLPESLSGDSIHPNADGYAIMQKEIVKYLK